MTAKASDLVARWTAYALDDARVAEWVVAERHGSSAWVACPHSQQAAEKAMKAVIVAAGTTPPYVHNLVTLAAIAPADLALPVSDLTLGLLTTYASTVRYVMSDLPDDPAPDWDQAAAALRDATAIVAACVAWLAAHGFPVEPGTGEPEP
jgi:HEPN domain-containing protein